MRCAQAGNSATSGRTNPAAETTIAAPAASPIDIRYVSGAPSGTVDGCTLAGGGSVVGILAVESNGTGYTWDNNIIDATKDGINFFTSGATQTGISGNRITNQTEDGGGGVMFTTQPANGVVVDNNVFSGNPTDINSISGGTGAVVSNNTSTSAGNFVVWTNTTGAVLTQNTVTNSTGSAFFIDGNNSDLVITSNAISGGGAATGIRVGNSFYAGKPSSGLTVSDNRISNRLNGIRVSPADPVAAPSLTGTNTNTITDNTVTGSVNDGILVQAGATSGVVVSSNVASGSTNKDCEDGTTGTGTLGTANTWTSNAGLHNTPIGLCDSYIGELPVRILDTRAGSGTQQGLPSPLAAGQTYAFTVAGMANVPANARAVAVNVTVDKPRHAGYLQLFPDNGPTTPLPNGSTLNFATGQTIANFDIVQLSSIGRFRVQASTDTDVVIDVVGYFTAASDYAPQSPARVLDTRPGSGFEQGTPGKVTPGMPKTVSLGSFAGNPSVGINVTVVKPAGGGYLKVYPVGGSPTASTINYIPGHDIANFDIVNVPPSGNITVETAGSAVDVVIDVVGKATDQFVNQTPRRILDTRPASNIGSITGPVPAGSVQSVQVAGMGGVPLNAKAVLINVTAVLPPRGGYLSVYPDSNGDGLTPSPNASTINYTAGQSTANFVIVQLPSDGKVNFLSSYSSVDVLFDVVGYIPRL
ncbi:MAG: hypothetical protein DLM57_16735 [Pseudonocardiales bacterium]|nr:MAG: hypothetical protein DLM57_16735 [Pseudonocardiales bacterium]